MVCAGLYPSTLSLLLRHLLLTYQTCHLQLGCSPAAASAEVKKLPEQLLPPSKPKDPAPLPCEDPVSAAKACGPLAVEDAQVCPKLMSATAELQGPTHLPL